ncbi:MAG: subclass B3 metallo-beta-lactamase [Chitinophagaceae bacterium]
MFTNAQTVNEPSKRPEEWSRNYAPFRIAGNLYYVGTYDLASYLITTPRGNILINTGLASSGPQIRSNIEALGFKFSDTRILLTTQAHYDHLGAMAEVQKATGAKMMLDEKDLEVATDGGSSDYELGGKGSTFKPVKVDRLLKNGDTISLGGMNLVMLHHPGHTKGSCSYLFDVKDENKTYRVLIANIPTIITDRKFSEITAYPGMAADYAYTLDVMKQLHFDLWVASHASQFDLHKKHKPGDAYNPEVFADRAGFDESLREINAAFLKKQAE